MVLVIDNYDSFVYNLARYVEELGFETLVKRNNHISVDEVRMLQPTHIILSPGPCTPDQAGNTIEIINAFGSSIPILGVCLGHQAIGQAYGGVVKRARFPMHGKSSVIHHNEKNIFAGCENPLRVARYHSLIVCEETLPDVLQVTAWSEQGEIMALRHRDYPVFGVQFHPESILTQRGYEMLRHFLNITRNNA